MSAVGNYQVIETAIDTLFDGVKSEPYVVQVDAPEGTRILSAGIREESYTYGDDTITPPPEARRNYPINGGESWEFHLELNQATTSTTVVYLVVAEMGC